MRCGGGERGIRLDYRRLLGESGAWESYNTVVVKTYWLAAAAAAAAKSPQSSLTLCDPIDGSPPGSPIPGILQARTLEWVAISFSNAWKWKVKMKSLSRVRLFATPWTAAYQAPPPMGFSRQEYWRYWLDSSLKHRNPEPYLNSFWFCRSEMRSENLHF